VTRIRSSVAAVPIRRPLRAARRALRSGRR
jgi:hypothetical protein